MSLQGEGAVRPFLTVLYIGDDLPTRNVEQLQYEGIGVVAVHSVARGLRLLTDCRVAAVICDVADPQPVTKLVATHTPVILLAGENADWREPGVSVVSRSTSSAALAGHVRQLAATNATDAKHYAA